MIALILAIAAAWVLIAVVGFALAIVITGLAYARHERQLAKEIRRKTEQAEAAPIMPLGVPLDDQGRPYR